MSAGECSSSESGWTMYLASPSNGGSNSDDDDYDDDGGDGEVDGLSGGTKTNAGGVAAGGGGEEDDDSMASDASSGTPGKQQVHDTCQDKKGGHCCSKCWEENQKGERGGRKGVFSSKKRDSSM